MERTKLFLVRHGETVWNIERRCQGHTDIPLNEKGVAQAEKLGDYMRDVPIDVVYASDLSRALQTAEIVARHHGLKVQTAEDLRERSYGEWEGLTREEIDERYPDQFKARREGGIFGIESFIALRQRVVNLLTELARKHTGQTILAVSHGGSINAFLHWVTEGKLGTGVTVIGNTSVTEVLFRGEREWEVVSVNQAVHLESVKS